jgi:cytochrome c-type biogenesis protein CcmH/NrfF
LISFLGRNSYLWLTPIFLIVVAFGGLVIAHSGKAVAPFIYFQF